MDNITSALGRRENPILVSPFFVPPSHSHLPPFLYFSPFSCFHTTRPCALSPATKNIESPSRKNTEFLCLGGFHNSRMLSLEIRDKAQRDRRSRGGRWRRSFGLKCPLELCDTLHFVKSWSRADLTGTALSYCCSWRNPEKETYESSPGMIVCLEGRWGF